MKKLLFVLGAFIVLVTLMCYLAKEQDSPKKAVQYAAIVPQPLRMAKQLPVHGEGLPAIAGSKYYKNEHYPKVPAACRSETQR